MKSLLSVAFLSTNRKVAAASADSTRKWMIRSVAMSRRAITAERGRPRNGKPTFSRSGGYFSAG